jgi:hypothetical protein
MAFVQRNQAQLFSGGLAYDSSVTAGNTLLAVFSVSVGTEVSVTSVSGGGTWENVGRVETPGTPRELSLWVCYSATGGSTTVTPSVSGTYDVIRTWIGEYSETGQILDQYAEAAGTGTSPSSGATGTTTAAVSLVIGCFTTEFNGVTFTGPGSPWTTRHEQADERIHVIDQNATSAAAFTASGTYDSSDGWGAICATFKANVVTASPLVGGGATAGHRRNRLAA